MSAPLEAYVGVDDEGWMVTPVVFAQDAEAGHAQIPDAEFEYVIWLEGAEGLQDLLRPDLHALLLMLGVAHQFQCRGCSETIWSEWQHNNNKAAPLMDWDEDELPDPVRVEGVGLFCSRGCWGRYAARQVAS